MDLKQNRRHFTDSSAKLRRARRLYHYMIKDFVIHGDNKVINYLCKQLVNNHLYVDQSPRGLRCILYRNCFRITCEWTYNGFEWYAWRDEMGLDDNFLRVK